MTHQLKQLELVLNTHGGKRRGAGRKCIPGKKPGVPHRRRLVHPHQPLHVTLRVQRDVWGLRGKRMYRAIRRALVKGCDRFGFRLVHHSVQGNHIHLVCEADDARALGRGLQGLGVRIARGINRLMGRRGVVLSDRYHSRTLRTPTEVRNALNYVLKNRKHHVAGREPYPSGWDAMSSAGYFTGWTRKLEPPTDEAQPGTAPKSWLLRVGWRRLGLLRL